MSKLRSFFHLLGGRAPGQLIIQFSDACNARCPQCELRAGAPLQRSTLDADALRRAIDAAAAHGVKALSFTGGEPLLHRELLFEMIHHAGQAGIPYIRTGSNGYVFRGSEKPGWEARVHALAEQMAASPLYTFWISLDSAVPEIHEAMRGLPGVVRGIEKALPIFAEHGIFPSANLGINRNTGGDWSQADPEGRGLEPRAFHEYFRRAFAEFYERVEAMGFSIVNACYPMSVESTAPGELDSVYGASSADHIVSFTPREKALLFQALLETVPEYRHRLRIFSPLSNLHNLVREYGHGEHVGYPCLGGIDYFFVAAADGHAYPCGFRGSEDLGPFEDMPADAPRPEAFCRQCDWECYRDPGELLGPLTEIVRRPFKLAARWSRDPRRMKLWASDLAYYRACSFFDMRSAPDFRRLARFRQQQNPAPAGAEELFQTAP